ncbi:hypothetical protein IVB40_07660 [Bradyrhizobium sp. 40]|uniref:spike base protein, RCAP_Rcc01079 family n=1 Tax=Bradyrhizobium sp. 40 TaxID=2782674 RepID=UPI0020003F2C|nr:hypothetical protein [Bradyrhizobium sp. 40]UPJ43936.1 hypothetical protein IVB40_07660 [Bradyrhizobium sp. 40]
MGVESAIGGLGPATGIVTVDVSAADQTLSKPSRGIMVGVSGDVAVTMIDGTSGTLPALNPGTIYAVAATVIKKTGTTATSVKALL